MFNCIGSQERCVISFKNMKKFIALMCVGAIALAGINGFDAQAKKKRTTKKVAKTEKVAPVNKAEQAKPECQGKEGCDKMKADCPKMNKVEGKKLNGLKKMDAKDVKKADCIEKKAEFGKNAECGKKAECDKKAGECKDMKAECGKGECKKDHQCAHQSPCCKEGACKKDGSCGKDKCKYDNENCCK